jgi:hypothetical protein
MQMRVTQMVYCQHIIMLLMQMSRGFGGRYIDDSEWIEIVG